MNISLYKILKKVCFLGFTTFSAAALSPAPMDYCDVVIPGGSSDWESIKAEVENYKAPYTTGVFLNTTGKGGTTLRSVGEKNPGNLLQLAQFSTDCYTALRDRDFGLAKKNAEVMIDILSGKYGLQVIKVPKKEKQKIDEITYRSVEQIASLFVSTDFRFKNLSPQSMEVLGKKNEDELNCILTVAQYFSTTPYCFQEISYDYSQIYGISENRYIMEPLLKERHSMNEQILDYCKSKYPDHIKTIDNVYLYKKHSLRDYLTYLYKNLGTKKMLECKAIDRGQTSGGHRNTCLFNSVFYYDLMKKNIPSTKIGSIEKGQSYLSHIADLHKSIPGIFTATPLPEIGRNLASLKSDRSAEANYSFEVSAYDGKISLGILSDCSALEIQCHSLLMNFMIFSKSKTIGTDNSLLSYFGCGYLGSENFPIVPVSCSTGHAQSLTLP